MDAKVRLLEVVDNDLDTSSGATGPPVKRLASTLSGLGVDTAWDLVVSDDPADVILRTARQLGSPLLVVGAHDHREIEHPALGRVSLAVVRDSPHPVLVVPARAMRRREVPMAR